MHYLQPLCAARVSLCLYRIVLAVTAADLARAYTAKLNGSRSWLQTSINYLRAGEV